MDPRLVMAPLCAVAFVCLVKLVRDILSPNMENTGKIFLDIGGLVLISAVLALCNFAWSPMRP